MATDPFDGVSLISADNSPHPPEIGQPTFVELIVAKRETGKAIRTICYDDDEGEEVCTEGPSPTIRLRELAYGKKREIIGSNPGSEVVAIPQAAKQSYKMGSNGYAAVVDAKAAKVENDFYELASNPIEALVSPSPSVCTSNILINGTFDSSLSGWMTAGDVFWQSSTASAVLRENPGGAPQSTLSQLVLTQPDKVLRLDFDLAVLFEYDDWALDVIVKNNDTTTYNATITQDDGFGTFSIGDIPAATTGIVQVEFINTSSVTLESKLLNIDNVKLCFDDAANTLVCDAGFNLIEKTDYSEDGRNNWVTDNTTINDRMNLTISDKNVDFGPSEFGVFFVNDQSESGVAYQPSVQTDLWKAQYEYDLVTQAATAIETDDPSGHVYIAMNNGVTSDIIRYNYDGSNRTTVFTEPVTVAGGITAMAIDPGNNIIYFGSDNAIKTIDITTLPATSSTTIYTMPSGDVTRMKLDFTNGHIYFVRNLNASDSQVLRINTSGSGETILTSQIPDARSLALDLHNDLVYVGTGEVSGEVSLYTLDVTDSTTTQLFATTPILPGGVGVSLRSISDLDFHPNGLLYMAGGYGIWIIRPDGEGFTNVYNSEQFVDAVDVKGAIHIGYRRSTVIKKLFRGLEPDAPVRFTAWFDDIIDEQGQIDRRDIWLRLARPEGGTRIVSFEDTDTASVTYSADASGMLLAAIFFSTDGNNAPPEVQVGLFECLVCGGQPGTRPQCTSAAPNEIDFQDFNENDGGFNDNQTWNSSEGLHIVDASHGSDPNFGFVTKVYTGLTPGNPIEYHFDLVDITQNGLVKFFIVNGQGGVIVEKEYTQIANNVIVSATPEGDTILVQFQYFGTGELKFDNCLLCSGEFIDCRIYNVSTELLWNGSPIRPINIFEGFLRYKLRSRTSSAVAYVNQPIIEATHLSGDITLFCDFWKQQGNGGEAESNPLSPSSNIGDVNDGDIVDANTRNWVWSTPVSGIGNDYLILSVNDPQTDATGRVATGDPICGAHIDDPNFDPTCVVESTSIMLNMNRILTLTELTELCPLEGLSIRLNFRDGKGINRSYIQDIDLASLYSIPESQIDPDIPWDEMTPLGDGVSGDMARWEEFTFVLDNPAGTGLNQCTTVDSPTFSGSGTLNFSAFELNGQGFSAEDCDPEVTITTEDEGSKTDEVQSIILPTPSAGTYAITLADQGVSDTTDVPWNADAAQLRVRLGRLNSIGGTSNVEVTGAGTVEDPFLVTFVRNLSARDMNLMRGDTTNLDGTGIGVIQTIRDGTFNEQQTIYNTSGTAQDFTITFNGATTVNLPYNVSITDMQNALQGIDSIGAGNAIVVGDTEDNSAEYEGPWIVKFQNDLGGENLPEMTINSVGEGYEVVTDWNGGGGINEIQELKLVADDGSYTLEFTNPDDANDVQTTGDIAYNASNTDILNVVVGSVTWLNNDNFNVRFMEDGDNGLIYQLIFRDTLWGIDIPQVMINTTELRGGEILIAEEVKGGGSREKQRIKMTNITGGLWTLTLDVPNIGDQTTADLDWNSTAQEIEDALLALPGVVEGDVSVGGDFPVYVVVFRKTLGNVDLMEADISRLECTGFVVLPVPPPPYDYELNQDPDLTPPPPPPPRDPLRDEQNVYSITNYQRYLFDPNFKNGLTVRDIALLKGVDLLDYTPYRRACDNSNLSPVEYDQAVVTKDSYVLVETAIDSVLERQRILKHFSTHREILPTRFVWECLEDPRTKV
jgi:hypothetical protein